MTVTRYTTTVHAGHAPTTGEVDRALADNLLGMVAGPGYGTAPDDRFVDLDPCSAHAVEDPRLPDAVVEDPRALDDRKIRRATAARQVFERLLADENVSLAQAAEAVTVLRTEVEGNGWDTGPIEAVLGVLAGVLSGDPR
jgi:hypothetical protein